MQRPTAPFSPDKNAPARQITGHDVRAQVCVNRRQARRNERAQIRKVMADPNWRLRGVGLDIADAALHLGFASFTPDLLVLWAAGEDGAPVSWKGVNIGRVVGGQVEIRRPSGPLLRAVTRLMGMAPLVGVERAWGPGSEPPASQTIEHPQPTYEPRTVEASINGHKLEFISDVQVVDRDPVACDVIDAEIQTDAIDMRGVTLTALDGSGVVVGLDSEGNIDWRKLTDEQIAVVDPEYLSLTPRLARKKEMSRRRAKASRDRAAGK